MTKEQALKKIKELQEYVEKIDKPKLGVTQYPTKEDEYCFINGVWALSIPKSDVHGNLFLSTYDGKWTDEFGNGIGGYFRFTPNKLSSKD